MRRNSVTMVLLVGPLLSILINYALVRLMRLDPVYDARVHGERYGEVISVERVGQHGRALVERRDGSRALVTVTDAGDEEVKEVAR